MKKKITLEEWERIEDALMKAEAPYKASFDSHVAMDGVLYEKIIEIEPFSVTHFEKANE